ncbi:MAG TPA: hypothetical protein VGX03_18815 [Candidatus Binatia bacterium]|nr:hypothetical protein [Candidatus Binatia bacterium]
MHTEARDVKLTRVRVVSATVALTCYLGAVSIAQSFDGLQIQNPLFHPGMLDFHQRLNDGGESTNLALWTPVFRGGVGRIDLKHGPTLTYAGGFLRALAAAPDAGDLILAAQTLSRTGVEAWEAQGEYRLPTGVLLPGSLGVGAGYVSQDRFGPNIWFTKLSYRDALRDGWQTIASVQIQEVGQRTSPGGYLALYNSRLMFTGGTDGEQWRTTVGYVHPTTGGQFRPAFEFFYVDETIGAGSGGKFLLATATLGYEGWGFLSHDSRLGRALGPQGLAFSNPIGFLLPMWNRLFDVTEVGGLLNGRVAETHDASGMTNRDWQLVGFPFQFDGVKDWKDWLFIGVGLRQATRQPDAPYLICGAIGQVGAFRVLAGGHWDLEVDELRFLLTIQYFL